ncbi:MAG TPA: hypothetical protein VFQ61_34940, partial [Polyangiaceae bacterium]|nr:hypothetical protein [Polyangiaceae bacterium]
MRLIGPLPRPAFIARLGVVHRLFTPLYVLLLVLCARVPWAWGAGSQAKPTAIAPVQVKYWEKWTGLERDAMRAVIDDFNRSQTSIQVEYVAVTAISQKLLVATAGGN